MAHQLRLTNAIAIVRAALPVVPLTTSLLPKVIVAMPFWPAPGSEDTELGVFMGPEVSHGKTKVYAGVQA
jgi:hypothetical protein